MPIAWSEDGKTLYFLNRTEVVARLFRYEIATGRREMVRRFAPADPGDLVMVSTAVVTPDGGAYAYAYLRATNSDLHLIEGMQ